MAQRHLLEQQKEKETASRAGSLHIFRLALKPLSYGASSFFNADPGGLRIPFDRPFTVGFMEMLGSWLRKHINTWSATACAREWPSSSRRLPTGSSRWDIFLPVKSRSWSTTPASGAASPFGTGLTLKDAKATYAWPRKL
jgi:hypothetical protein